MRIALFSFIFVLSISFLGIGSSAWACPPGHVTSISPLPQCVSPGGPDPKDGITTIPEYQMECMDVNKGSAHAQPIISDKDDCKAPTKLWECCAQEIQPQ